MSYSDLVLAEDTPMITDWMQGWGSIAGLMMSTLAVAFTGLLLRHEIRVRREERRDLEAAQARLILPTLLDFSDEIEPSSGEFRSIRWEVVNHSATPILALRAELRLREYRKLPTAVKTIGKTVPIISGNHVGNFHFEDPFWNKFDNHPSDIFSLIIWFTDAGGRQWTRVDYDPPRRINY